MKIYFNIEHIEGHQFKAAEVDRQGLTDTWICREDGMRIFKLENRKLTPFELKEFGWAIIKGYRMGHWDGHKCAERDIRNAMGLGGTAC